MYNLFLVFLALIPAVVLCVYTFKKDRVEKEPIGLLLKLLLLGACACWPASLIEGVIGDVIEYVFLIGTAAGGGSGDNVRYAYIFIKYFFGVALVEEGVKLAVLLYTTRKNKEYNSFFDGIIYSVFVSLGFAALENVLYVLLYGIGTAIARAVLSVPGHMCYAVLMGYYYSLWHITDKASAAEKSLKSKGLIPGEAKEFSSSRYAFLCILIPFLVHGLYDFCCMAGEWWAIALMLAVVVYMYVHCFRKIRRMSKADGLERDYVKYMICSKYPGISTEDAEY